MNYRNLTISLFGICMRDDSVKIFFFLGATGRAFLFRRVVNVRESAMEPREMMTGRHHVRDIFCLRCDAKLGWMYEYAVEADQRYKEGKFFSKLFII